MSSQEKIAKILRCDRDYIFDIDRRLTAVTGRKGIFEKIMEENDNAIKERFFSLGISRNCSAKDIYDALISKVEADNHKIFLALKSPNYNNVSDCKRVAEAAIKITGSPKGFFLKYEKAKEFLTKEPPKKVMKFLGYDSIKSMLAKEDLLQIYSALRFVEGSEWLNNVFFKQYESLQPEDFEERETQAFVVSKNLAKAAEGFTTKKKHNISHLKELGVVFVIPTMLGISGEILRMFSLILHYLHEIPFYSRIFKNSALNKEKFAADLISLLRGDVWDKHLPENEQSSWLVVQRYLAKDDENDWRLFMPRINPEALHWLKAEDGLVRAGELLDGFSYDLSFWQDLDWVGNYFKDEIGNDVLVSFDLVDTVMSLVKEKEMVKYLYHHQEALWNKIFIEYFSREELEEYARKYVLRGYFTV